MKKPLLLIDGDQFLFKCTAALEREVKWDEHNHVLYSNSNECWDSLEAMLGRVFEHLGSTDHALCFSAPPNFRQTVDHTYKAHRKDARKPLCYADLRERVEGSYNCVSMVGLEADDVMGILATKPGNQLRSVIVSQDKDMKTIPTRLWRENGLQHITEEEADYWHLYQTLVGDTSDGYKGCPGIGPKKAEALLTSCQNLKQDAWPFIVRTFEKAGLTAEDAITQARLARILRWGDWDYEKKEPILWTPK